MVIDNFIENMIDQKIDQKMLMMGSKECDPNDDTRYFTVEQAAKYIGVSKRSIYNYLDNGLFNRIYFGNSIRIDKCEIIQFANSQINATA